MLLCPPSPLLFYLLLLIILFSAARVAGADEGWEEEDDDENTVMVDQSRPVLMDILQHMRAEKPQYLTVTRMRSDMRSSLIRHPLF